jgi:hypothetical protein
LDEQREAYVLISPRRTGGFECIPLLGREYNSRLHVPLISEDPSVKSRGVYLGTPSPSSELPIWAMADPEL